MKKLSYILFLLLLSTISFAQKTKIDSLQQALKAAKEDTNKVKILNDLCKYAGYRIGNYDTALFYANNALKLAKKINDKKGIVSSYNRLGIICNYKANYSEALKYLYIALNIEEKIRNQREIASLNNNIGIIFSNQGNFIQALKNYLVALKIDKQIGNKKGVANAYGNIAYIYSHQGNYPEALKNYLASIKINKEIGNQFNIAGGYINLGVIYFYQKNYSESLKNYLAALKIDKLIGDRAGVANIYDNIGAIFLCQGNYSKALKNISASLKINKIIGDKLGVVFGLHTIGLVKLKEFKPSIAKKWFQKSLIIAKQLENKENIRENYKGLSQADSALGNYKSAYQNYKMYIIYRDSLKNKENTKKITQMQMQFKFDQKQAADSIAHTKEKEIQQAKIAKQNAVIKAKQEQQYALFGGLALLLVFVGFMYNRFRVTSKQKKIIERQKAETEHQKQLLEVKNKEISDSINYAKRIQEAILPSRFSLAEGLKTGFVLFKPKDIVSGDFYWLEKVGEAIYFAAADCTGHGVPGAMVSVVCANALSKALLEENITETGKLLDRTREIVIQQFSHSDENVKDGMDISLCKLTLPPSGGAGGGLQWSGANNPLWIINKNRKAWFKEALPFGEGLGGAEIKPDKQPIGKTENPKPFKTHNIELEKGDSIYVFSDGYADQFGGKEGKKFKYKPLKELLLSLQNLDMDNQKEAINRSFIEWRGDEEQVDDVCVIGVRI